MGAITAELVDTGEKRDGRGRRMMARTHRMALIESYRASGLTMAEFARRESVNYTTFAGWIAKAGKALSSRSPMKFAEVRLPTPPPVGAGRGDQVEVRLPDGTVLRGGRVADLVAVIKALRT
jgi:transposase-like protein